MSWEGFTIFQNMSFMELYCTHKKYEIFNINGTIAFTKKIQFLGHIYMSISFPEVDNIIDTVKMGKNICEKKSVGYLGIKTECRGELLDKYLVDADGTLVVNLDRNIDDIWKKLDASTRRQVRQAEKSAAVCNETERLADFNEWWKIYKKTSESKGFLSEPYNLVSEVFKHHELSRLFVSKIDGQVVSGTFLLIDNTPMWWLGGTDLHFSEYRPNNLIQWEIIKWAKEKGFPYYDMGGAVMKRKHGPTLFKKGFGGDYYEYYIYDIPIKKFKDKISKFLLKNYAKMQNLIH